MDYFDDVFHTFLGLDSVNCLAVSGTVTSLPVLIQNILNCVPKMNEAFMGLERHGGKWLMTKNKKTTNRHFEYKYFIYVNRLDPNSFFLF